jgi:hypothetical protein
VCHEGKSKTKKRFYLYEGDGIFKVFCHNCEYSKSFTNFLKDKFPAKYDYLSFQYFNNTDSSTLFGGNKQTLQAQPIEVLPSQKIHDFFIKYFKDYCIQLNDPQLDKKKEKLRRYALKILIDRNIPQQFIDTCFFCYKGHYQWRIIIPFINDKGLYYNFQARDIHPKPDQDRKDKKYIFANFGDMIQLPDDKIFNKYSVDASHTVYIFEGIFKSLFIKNSVAMCNANVTGCRADEIKRLFLKRVWILDSPWKDKTGLEATIKLLKMGESCFIMPLEHKDCKDMDELAKKLKVQEFSEDFIKKYTYSGEMGLLQLKMMEIINE